MMKRYYKLPAKTIKHLKHSGIKHTYSKILSYLNKERSRINNSSSHKNKKFTSGFKDSFDFQFNQNNNEASEYKSFSKYSPLKTDIKLIAYYLPQFHPIPENNRTWGEGFTEWTNVSKALPQFDTHYQPRLPGELGFYDLRLKENQRRQIELAKNYGLHGFCYHYYWFNGRKVMDKPLQQVLDNPELDFPFCINWANENWTKRWDGMEEDIIVAQNHSQEDDLAFLEAIKPILTDKRYIRIDNKPLLMVYRPQLFPNMKETAQRWREHAKKIGIGELYLVLTHSFEHLVPKEIGFNAAAEFAPNSFEVMEVNEQYNFFNKEYQGTLYDYESAINYSMAYNKPDYTKFRSICPSWDNEARKPGKGISFVNANPSNYKRWLEYLLEFTDKEQKDNEKLIFINAWNEWAEGAYLEPDRKYGYAYLDTTYNTLKDYLENKKKILIVSHDAYFHGAQYLALNIGKYLKEYFNYTVEFLLNGEGGLIPDFESIGKVHHLYFMNRNQQNELFQKLNQRGFLKAIANTSVVGEVVEGLSNNYIEVLSLIHEMKSVIKDNKLENSIEKISQYASTVIFPSNYVKQDFKEFIDLSDVNCTIAPQGLFRKNSLKYNKAYAKEKLQKELRLNENSKTILNIAYGDKRKGIDLFVKTAIAVVKENRDTHFIWVGHYQEDLVTPLKEEIKSSNVVNNIHFVGLKQNIEHYYAGSDIFFLSSREDPFPSVVLDAMNVGLPVIAFKDAGGFADILSDDCGVLVENENCNEVIKTLNFLLSNKEQYDFLSSNSRVKIEEEFSFTNYLFRLLGLLKEDIKKVSVIVPSYNYEEYIADRINSILAQTYPIYEIIFLDDNSSDNSLSIATKLLQNSNIPFTIIANNSNSGSVFKQWSKGIESAKGEYIWIAESDDISETNFLQEVVKGFINEEVILSFSQSKIIDEYGEVIEENYFDYTNDISKEKWKNNYINDGIDELKTSLVIKNTIPNVSSVVFKKIDLTIIDELMKFRVGGDWYFYIHLLEQGKIAYCSEPLNMHRRHTQSVTVSKENNKKHLEEIIQLQDYLINKFEIDSVILEKVYLYREHVEKNLGLKLD